MIQTTTLLTTYNGDIMENSFLKVKHFLRELCALLITYLPTEGRDYEMIPQINFNLKEWIYPVRNNAPLEFLTGFTE
jgi:hypothetical protein